jgi:hypothetical protein
MSKMFYHVMQDNVGNLLFGVSGTMRLAGSGTLATIYGDEALTAILPNPMTNHASYGSFKCFLGAGDYDFYMAKAGYTFETLTGVQGHGSMAQQDAGTVAITGGTITNLSVLQAIEAGLGTNAAAGFALVTGTTPVYIGGKLGLGINPPVARVDLTWTKATVPGLAMRPSDTDTGQPAVQFLNAAGVGIGSIGTTVNATAFNTASDARLKHDVDDLTGELALLQALRPVSFRWLADDSPGVGFLAQEVAAHVQGVVTGEADEVNPDGTIKPQMIDYSKLVPFLVGAVKTLTARIAVLEDALGV